MAEQDTRVRVRFITKDESTRVTDAPLAVPTQLGRKGLSEVIEHLRGRGNAEGAADASPAAYDFVIEGQLLRCSLEKFLRATGLSTEATVTVEYFLSLSPPSEGPKASGGDTWIASLACMSGGRVAAGSYEGALQCYRAKDCKALQSVEAHEGPVKALAASTEGGNAWVVTGGKDRVVKRWGEDGPGGLAASHVLVGHENSVESLAVREQGAQVLSGDWSGMLLLWKLLPGSAAEEEGPVPAKKKRKDKAGARAAAVSEVNPSATIKAHAQCVSGVQWDPTANERVFTSSWDHSIRVWDLERQDCVQTLSGSKVVTCMAVSSSQATQQPLVASGHPDHRIRVWDVRVGPEEAAGKRALGACGSWVSGIEWHPLRANVLASVSHDGRLRMWDIRASKALCELEAHGDKALALCFKPDGSAVFTAGADGVVRSFVL